MARKPNAESARARFAALLARYLASGTRPGAPHGEPWTFEAFAAKVPSSRDNEFVSPRTVSNWCHGRALPTEIEPILRVLFGPTKDRNEAREAFRAVFLEARSEVFAKAKPDPAGPTVIVQGDVLAIDRSGRPSDMKAAADRSCAAAISERYS